MIDAQRLHQINATWPPSKEQMKGTRQRMAENMRSAGVCPVDLKCLRCGCSVRVHAWMIASVICGCGEDLLDH